jgi:hypothetical protein
MSPVRNLQHATTRLALGQRAIVAVPYSSKWGAEFLLRKCFPYAEVAPLTGSEQNLFIFRGTFAFEIRPGKGDQGGGE